MLLWNNRGDFVCTSFPYVLSCPWSRSQQLTAARGWLQPQLPQCPSSYLLLFLLSTLHPRVSPSSPQSISPLWIKRSGRTAGNHTLLTPLSQHREYHALRAKHSLPSSSFPTAWLSAPSTTPFSCPQFRVLSPHPPFQFSLWATHLGSATKMSHHTHPGKDTPWKWAQLRLIPQIKRNTNYVSRGLMVKLSSHQHQNMHLDPQNITWDILH